MGINKEGVKRVIWWIEFIDNGFKNLCGTDVEVLNMQVKKSENKVMADIVLWHSVEQGHSERFNNCEYDLDKLLSSKLYSETGGLK